MATQVNFFYASYCRSFMTLNIDDNSLFVTVPSESNGESYKVTLNEETMQVESCSCLGFRYYSRCKHCTIVSEAYSNVSQSFTVNAAMDASDSLDEQYEEVAFSEQIETTIGSDTLIVTKVQKIATPVLATKLDHHSALVLSFFSGLPSRQRAA